MSNYDSGDDGMDELEELIQEYQTEENQTNKSSTEDGKSSEKKRETKSAANEGISMEQVLFGDKNNLLKNLTEGVKKRKVSKNSDCESDDDSLDTSNERKRKPAWEDDDDEELKLGEVKRRTRFTGPLDHLPKDKLYKDYLASKYTQIVNQPKWASLEKTKGDKDEDSSDEELLKSVGFIEKTSESLALRKHTLQYKARKDLNRDSYAEGSITSVQFHPTSTAALVCGAKGLATIYSVDGIKNEKLHNMRFHKFPMKCAKITPCGTKAIFGSVRKYYYSYDLLSAKETKLILPPDMSSFHRFELSPCGRYIAAVGKFGMVHLLTASSNELIHTFKQEETAENICFTRDSLRLICNADSCNVSIFSIRQLRMEHKFVDDGCIKGSVLDVAPNQRLLATGSMEGVVNIYDMNRVLQSDMPAPEKSFMNLTTAISHVRFNHSSEILGMCSGLAPNSVKLAHISSATVFANFPDFQAKLGNVQAIEFSPSSGFMALGTKVSKVPLFRLKHYKHY